MIDPLEPTPNELPSLVGTKKVPNVIPENITTSYRLAILGEAPGADEEAYGVPFVGASGRLLDSVLGTVGVDRSQCFIGNVCQYRPPGNDISEWGYDHPRVQEGVAELSQQLTDFQPHCILALGNTPMWFLTGKPFGVKGSGVGISDYACFIHPIDKFGCKKVVASYHPAYTLREYWTWVLLKFAAQRARMEAESAELGLPRREFDLDLSANEICHRLDSWPAGLPASIDIEGGLDGWICLSVVSHPLSGFIIAFGQHTESEQGRLYVSISRFLYRSDVPKVLQNSLYELFVLAYGFNMLVRNVREDTMLKQWELYPELPKGLDTIASIWTREPQWKFLIAYSKTEQARRAKLPTYDPAKEIRNKHLACCIDSAVTLEASLAQDSTLDGDARRHYLFNVDLLRPIARMELRGIKYDTGTAAIELGQVKASLAECRTRISTRVGYDLCGGKGSLSSTKLRRCLYEEKSYPPQYSGRGPDKKITTDVEALLNLRKKFPNDPLLSDVLLHRKLESILETLEVSTDPDGRVRCGYNLVGTETGRLTCYTSPTGSGANLQTITKKLRKLYTADDGYWLFQCDLSGADGWTVAAHCLRLGDPTMWDDYRAGLKPAKILALMYQHGADATRCSREELRERCKVVDQDGWLYFACKRVQHGTNYGMQETTMSTQIMKDSYKMTGQAIYVEKAVCAQLQRLYLVRYSGVYSWHTWAKKEVFEGRNLKGASGHTRVFLGRRRSFNPKTRQSEADHETWKEFLSTEPQDNTGYANNLVLHRLWTDPENRIVASRTDTSTAHGLVIEPLHTVHDAVIGQFRKEHTAWAVPKIRSWYQNVITIAGTELIIPFEGAYGPSWGELGAKYGGGEI